MKLVLLEGEGMLGYVWEYGYSLAASALLSIYAVFRYGFETRWRALRPLLERAIVWRFSRDLRDRLSALKRAAEDPALVARL